MMKARGYSNTKGVSKKPFIFVIFPLFVLIFLGLAVSLFYYYASRPFSGSTEILVLGTAGEGQSGSDLTDTIIYLSVDHQSGRILVLSIPRDIWLSALRTKLNAVYHYQGLEGAKKAVAEILGQPVEQAVVVDFQFLVKLIDQLGGVEVEVEKAFQDDYYPIAGRENDSCDGDPEYRCRFETLQFEAGRQTMDGQRALKFVRSRHAEGEEGSDFARNKRQQQVLAAIEKKIFSFQFFSQPQRVLGLIKLLKENVITDIPPEKLEDLARVILRIGEVKLEMEALDGELLTSPPSSGKLYDNQWVLVPIEENWQRVHERVEELLTD